MRLKSFGASVFLGAEPDGLRLTSSSSVDWTSPETWPSDALRSGPGRRTAYEVASLLEMGLAQENGGAIQIKNEDVPEIESEEFKLVSAFTQPSPFLLKIDRTSDLGRPDFTYRYKFFIGSDQVAVTRLGYFAKRTSRETMYKLDENMFRLVDAMDRFNALPSGEKKPQRSWLDFANIKGWARQTDAQLEATLAKNDVIVPSSIGLDLFEDPAGALSFMPTCPELDDESFRTVFDRNLEAEGFYSLDRPGMGKIRIVLNDSQKVVLQRMKKVRRVTGPRKDDFKENPATVFDGIIGDIDLPYSDRVLGIGQYDFEPIPNLEKQGGIIDWIAPDRLSQTPEDLEPAKKALPQEKLTLLIDTHGESVRPEYLEASEAAKIGSKLAPFERPQSLSPHVDLRSHQIEGVRWLQNCAQIQSRSGVLLADDMGLGKTLQILTFLSWCIESGRFPDLSRAKPPFRPILIVAPLILLENETWEKEMKRFFQENGDVFGSCLALYGPMLKAMRRKDAEGREDIVAKPILQIDKIQRHQVVITNYEAVRDYEFSFAYFPDGKSLWSIVITDEAQEYKTPNSKISHAMKALKPDFRIACTGTPVENRLLDLWNLFDTVQPGLLGSAKQFASRYETGADPTAMDELKERLLYGRSHAFLLRRNKEDVLELPPKVEQNLVCSMTPEELAVHQNLSGGIAASAKPKSRLDLLGRFARASQHPALLDSDGDDSSVEELKRTCSKLREVLSLLHHVQRQKEKAIIFARHKDVQRMLARVLSEEFRRPVRIINGDTAKSGSAKLGVETRRSILRDFQETPGFGVLVLSPFVAGVGLTIVEANHVVHYGRWWNPAVESQATDRAYRIGQTKQVHVYYPILVNSANRSETTFDQALDKLMKEKKSLAAGLLAKGRFLEPQPSEETLAFQVFSNLQSTVQS